MNHNKPFVDFQISLHLINDTVYRNIALSFVYKLLYNFYQNYVFYNFFMKWQ